MEEDKIYCTTPEEFIIEERKRGKSIIKIGDAGLGGTDIKIEVSTKFNWLQKKLWKYLLNIKIEDIEKEGIKDNEQSRK